MKVTQVLATLALGSAVGVGLGVLAHRVVPESPIVRGLLVESRVMDRRDPVAWMNARREAALAPLPSPT